MVVCERWTVPLDTRRGASGRWFGDWVLARTPGNSAHVTASWAAAHVLRPHLPPSGCTVREYFGGLGCQALIFRHLYAPSAHRISELHPAGYKHLARLFAGEPVQVTQADAYAGLPAGHADLVALDFGDMTARKAAGPRRAWLTAALRTARHAVMMTDSGGTKLHLHRARYEADLGGPCGTYREYLASMDGWLRRDWGGGCWPGSISRGRRSSRSPPAQAARRPYWNPHRPALLGCIWCGRRHPLADLPPPPDYAPEPVRDGDLPHPPVTVKACGHDGAQEFAAACKTDLGGLTAAHGRFERAYLANLGLYKFYGATFYLARAEDDVPVTLIVARPGTSPRKNGWGRYVNHYLAYTAPRSRRAGYATSAETTIRGMWAGYGYDRVKTLCQSWLGFCYHEHLRDQIWGVKAGTGNSRSTHPSMPAPGRRGCRSKPGRTPSTRTGK